MTNTLVNLISKQIAPNYMAIRHLKPDKVILCYTQDTHNETRLLIKALNKMGILEIGKHKIDPFDLQKNRSIARDIFSNKGPDNKVVLNYTGGTKQMSIPFYHECIKQNQRAMYVDTQNECIWWTQSGAYRRERFSFKIDVMEYFLLSGHTVEVWRGVNEIQRRAGLTHWLFNQHYISKQNRATFKKLRNLLSDAAKSHASKTVWKGGQIRDIIDIKVSDSIANVVYHRGNRSDQVDIPKDQHTQYFSGGWFEEFVYLKLFQSGYFDDIQCRLLVYPLNPINPGDVEGEIDVIGIRNGIPYFIECKTGHVEQHDVNKLDNIAEIFGGRYAIPILITLWTPKKQLERIDHLSIELITTPYQIEDLIKNIKKIEKTRM